MLVCLQQYLSTQLFAGTLLPKPLMQRTLLCYTLSNQRCDLLTITDFNCLPEDLSCREYVVITARVHPGETCASWIMQVSVCSCLAGVAGCMTSCHRLAQTVVHHLPAM